MRRGSSIISWTARDEYRALVFAPYLFWPAYACGLLAPERSILMPCLHDEPEAKLELFGELFADVRGLWFLSEPEQALAQRIHRDLAEHEVVGSGVAVPTEYDAEGFRTRHGIDGPFVLYAVGARAARAGTVSSRASPRRSGATRGCHCSS